MKSVIRSEQLQLNYQSYEMNVYLYSFIIDILETRSLALN